MGIETRPSTKAHNTGASSSRVNSPKVTNTNVANADQLWSNIEEKLKKWGNDFKHEFTKLLDMKVLELEQTIDTKLHEMNFIFEQKIKTLSENQNRLELELDALQRDKLSTDLIIFGVPETHNENLKDTVNMICQTINSPPPSIQAVFRAKSSRGIETTNTDACIVLKLDDRADKINMLKAIVTHCKNTKSSLKLSDIGFDSRQSFFVNESLTKRNYHLEREAIKLKRRKLIFSTHTSNGQIYIRIESNQPAIIINSMDDLTNAIGSRTDDSNKSASLHTPPVDGNNDAAS